MGLGQQVADQNFFSNQRGQDINPAQVGANIYSQSLAQQLAQGQGLSNLGLAQQQASLYPFQQYANMLNPLTGLNQTGTNTQGGNALSGAIGGGLTAAQLYRIFGGP